MSYTKFDSFEKNLKKYSKEKEKLKNEFINSMVNISFIKP